MRLLPSFLLTVAAQTVAAFSPIGKRFGLKRENDGLQDVVTYDEHSLMIHGERIFIFSGEFHPYRLPVPGLWLDIFQKVKAIGFSAVSFYTDWALFEGEPGVYRADGVFALEPFFAAASEAGIYLIARPGPYINAESSGGGFPGWLQRIRGVLRTRAPDYLVATDNYAAHVGAAIAKAQITNGGPVILVQPENEYSQGDSSAPVYFPDPVYMKYVEDQLRNASISVPLILNDAATHGYFAPGSETNGTADADVDIYGYDSYPLGFDCANPTVWPSGAIPTSFHSTHEEQSPSTFNSIEEFQGGSFDPWGGPGFDRCAILLNHEFGRVFYKNNFAAATSLLNLYMIWGGTNWGNNGHEGGYTSYDYGAAISEDRGLTREKYSELKLEANFLKATPAYLTVSVGNLTAKFTTGDLVATPLLGDGTASNFYIIRHSDFSKTTASNYTLFNIPTSLGTIATIPQLGGSLTLSGRDSKWFVTDYDLGGTTLLYSTAEIFTWKVVGTETFLIVYGGPNEVHELAVISTSRAVTIEGTGINTSTTNSSTTISWATSPTRRVVQIGSLFVYILDRNTAYNYWVLDLPRADVWGNFSANLGNTTSVIVQAGYLLRTAIIDTTTLKLTGDLNATVPLRVIAAPVNVTGLTFNGEAVDFTANNITGELTSTLTFIPPAINIPDLSTLDWKYLDNLPETQPGYSDTLWKPANLNQTFNSYQAQVTPTSLFGSDYGFNTGILIFRGHFTALGTEKTFTIHTIGGYAFGSSVFLNSTSLGSWSGIDESEDHSDTYTLPNIVAGSSYVLTVLVDNQGLAENGYAGNDGMKTPRGILDYSLDGQPQTAITWKLTGNLGGEQYVDKVRGPLNEGGLFAERQGFTQPFPPSQNWTSSSPLTGITGAGVGFYAAELPLNLPAGYDIPLSFVIANTTRMNGTGPEDFRVQLWVNGWQFGKYVNSVGPQTAFPVPEGILNYQGTNWIGIELWAQQATGAALKNFTLVPTVVIQSGYGPIGVVDSPSWTPRADAY